MSESAFISFNGKARLFPLPNVVLFPHVMQPLHIFEPRYRQMTRDALEGDRLIALAAPLPGWESDYAGSPALHSIACLGQIAAEQQLDDGRFNILLRGVARIRIVREIPCEKLYRVARCEIVEQTELPDEQTEPWRSILIAKAPTWFAGQAEAVDQFRKLLHSDLPLGAVCDIMSFALPLDADVKQGLLEEANVEARLRTLHQFMEGKKQVDEAIQRRFPPEFSVN